MQGVIRKDARMEEVNIVRCLIKAKFDGLLCGSQGCDERTTLSYGLEEKQQAQNYIPGMRTWTCQG